MTDDANVIAWPFAGARNSPPDVRAARRGLAMTQAQFARTFGFALSALRGWERGLPVTDPIQRTLLTLIHRDPGAVRRALDLGPVVTSRDRSPI
jgi:DNA-binding transcriptional regulator YiaG